MVGGTPSFPRIPTWRGTFPLDRCAACDRRLTETAEAPAFRFKVGTTWRSMSWSEADTWAREIAAGLVALGVGVGDRVAILDRHGKGCK